MPKLFRIYIVEDEALIAMELGKRLKQLGYVVAGSAARGEVAVEEISANPPDLVLMDIRLAGELDGIETAARLRGVVSVPVVFLSAYSDAALLENARGVEPFGYLVKPFEGRELHATVEMALYKHTMEQKLREANATLEQKVRERTAELEAANMALAASNVERQEAQKLAHLGYWLVDVATGRLEWCDEVFNIFGRDPLKYQADFGTFVQDIVHPDDRETVLHMDRDFRRGEDFELDHRILRPDGSIRWVHVKGKARLAQSGEVAQLAGTIQDITDRKLAEAEIAERESRLQDFFENASDLVQMVAEDGRILFVNRIWRQKLGYSLEEARAMNIFDVIAPECSAHCETVMERLAQGQTPGLVRVKFVSRHDHVFEVEGSLNSRFENGEFAHSCGIFRDITHRQEVQRQIAILIKELKDVRLALDEHCIVAITDPQGKITYANDKFCQLSKYSWTELMGQDHRLVNSGHHPSAFFRDMWETIGRGEVWQGVVRNRAKDGVFYWMDSTIVPFLDSERRPTQYISIRTDITALKDAEDEIQRFTTQLERMVTERGEALKRSEQRFRAMFFNSVDGILVARDGKVVMANNALIRMLGYTDIEDGLELEGQSILEFVPPDYREELLRRHHRRLAGELFDENYEVPFVRRDGSTLTAELRSSRFLLGDEPYVIVICRDITERKQAEQNLLRSQRMQSIGTLAGGIAHDVNNTLAPILMSVEVLLEQAETHEVQYLELIESSARRCGDMVRQLLTFAKGSVGQRITLNLRPLIKEIEQFVTQTFDRSIQLKSSVKGDLMSVMGDATQMHQLILNLCVNARDAMPKGGTLTIGAFNREVDKALAATMSDARAGSFVCITVQDTGTGIPKEIQERIFEPFFTTKEPDRGTGLGLATVLGIVRGHGGFLHLDSKEGVGTRFELFLPAAEETANDATGDDGQKLSGEGRLVLVVDDEPMVQESLTAMLEMMDFRVVNAHNGMEAINVYSRHSGEVKILITDINMPSLDGVGLVRALKRLNPYLGVIAMSGLQDPERLSRLEDLGVLHILGKPFTGASLIKALKETLQPPALVLNESARSSTEPVEQQDQ